MFLSILDDLEKESFLEIVTYAMSIDNEVNLSEIQWIKLQCLDMGIPYRKVDVSNFSLKKNLSVFESIESKRAMFMELLSMFFIDKIFSREEKNLLDQVATYFQFTSHYMEKSIVFAKNYSDLFYSGRELINE